MHRCVILAFFLTFVSVVATELSCGKSTWQQSNMPHHPIQRHPRRQSATPRRRIIGGIETKPKAWPWMAYLFLRTYSGEEIRCGATIVSNRWLLTAAHCITGFWKGTALVGFKDVHDWYTHESYFIESIIAHPGYDPYDNTTFHHDIALIKVIRNITFNEYVQPICLSVNDSHFSKPYHYGYVTGWGYYSKPIPDDSDSKHNSTEPEKHYVVHGLNDKLNEAEIPFIDYEMCRSLWKSNVGDGHICAGALQKGTAKGDSGGPLQVRSIDGRWYLVGITSFGADDYDEQTLDQATYPGVYTRVSYYCSFIAEKTWGTVECAPDTGSSISKTFAFVFASSLVLLHCLHPIFY